MSEIKHTIAYLTDDFPPFSLGGAGVIAFEEACALSDLGHNVIVITTVKDGSKAGISIENGIKIYRIYSNYHKRWRGWVSMWNFGVAYEVEKILKEEKPDIIHAHNIHNDISYSTLRVAQKYSKKVFLTAHDTLLVHFGKYVVGVGHNFKEHKLPFRNFFIKRYIKNVTIFSVSNALKELLEMKGVKNIHTLHNGIDERKWQNVDEETKKELIDRYGLEGKKVILFAGRISGLKGGKLIPEVLKRVRTEVPEARLLMVGSVETLNENIISTGPVSREQMKYLYSLTDVVVVPSIYLDPFPTINLEAMACSRPVVGTNQGGTKEAIEDGKNGFIADPTNINLFSNKIIELLSNPERAREMGNEGHTILLKKFTIETHIKNLLAWYNGDSK